MNVFRTPSPTPPPSPKEQTFNDNFTVIQLEHLYDQVMTLNVLFLLLLRLAGSALRKEEKKKSGRFLV